MTVWWEAKPDDRLSQGDIVTQNKGEVAWRESTEWTPNREGAGNVLARGRVGAVIVLSHDCELDKQERRRRVVVAPVLTVSDLPEAEREQVLAQRKVSRVVLPDVPLLGTGYADLRLIMSVDRDFLPLERRVGSLTPEGVGQLRLQMIAFFTRLDATANLDDLSVRNED
jgi:hypothetical protein